MNIELFTRVGTKLVAEASTLGFPVGQWPIIVAVDVSDGVQDLFLLKPHLSTTDKKVYTLTVFDAAKHLDDHVTEVVVFND